MLIPFGEQPPLPDDRPRERKRRVHHAAQAGFAWDKGGSADAAAMDKVAQYMADALIAAIRMRPLPAPLKQLYLTEPIAELGRGFEV